MPSAAIEWFHDQCFFNCGADAGVADAAMTDASFAVMQLVLVLLLC